MSVESAKTYIERMRADADFRQRMNQIDNDEEAGWALIKSLGYDFSLHEFKQAQELIYQERGIVPEF